MKGYDFAKEHFVKVKVCGIECLFNDARISRDTVPERKYHYEIGGDDESGGEPVRVQFGIMINFFGTLICDQPLPLGNNNTLWLQKGDFVWI